MSAILTLDSVSKTFSQGERKGISVLKDISLEIKEHEFFILVGPSGSGKSTLLRIMSGLEREYTGSVVLAPGYNKRDMSFVFQQFALLPWLTVYENIELGLLSRVASEHERAEIVNKELAQFGLERFARSYPKELSGGMRQRVGLARSLAVSPKILFMDEPFSELDSFTAEELRGELLNIWRERGLTVIMVTHIVEEAIELADRIAVFTPRPARVERIYENTLSRPRNRRAEQFFDLADKLYATIKP